MMKKEHIIGKPYVRIALLIIAAACIAFGLMREEELMVLQKAVNVCLECIGIG